MKITMFLKSGEDFQSSEFDELGVDDIQDLADNMANEKVIVMKTDDGTVAIPKENISYWVIK